MAPGNSSHSLQRVVIAGGGFAAVEAALALKALAGDRVQVALLAPDAVFHYRPAATSESFDVAPTRGYDLQTIAADIGASYHRGRLEAVASRKHWARTAAGARLQYDRLILATGARSVARVSGAITFRDQRDVSKLRRMVAGVETGVVRRVVFALPAGTVWPLPLYELALMSARRAKRTGNDARLHTREPEETPLAIFGQSGVSAGWRPARGRRGALHRLLGRRRRFVATGRSDSGTERGSQQTVSSPCPSSAGAGSPACRRTRSGFVPADAFGRVEGLRERLRRRRPDHVPDQAGRIGRTTGRRRRAHVGRGAGRPGQAGSDASGPAGSTGGWRATAFPAYGVRLARSSDERSHSRA